MADSTIGNGPEKWLTNSQFDLQFFEKKSMERFKNHSLTC